MTVAEAAVPPAPASPGVSPAVRWLVAAMSATSLVALGLVAMVVPAAWPGWERFALVTLIAAVTHVESTYAYRTNRRVRFSFSFIEIGVLVALVALPGVVAPLSVLAGSIAYEVAIRREPLKLAFNAAQHTLGACSASLALAALPSLGSVAFGVSLVSASLAVVAYVATTTALWLLLLVVLSGRSAVRDLPPTIGLDAVAALATTSVGVVGVYLWAHDLVLLVYSVVPLVAILLAYRYLRLSRELMLERSAGAEGLRRLVSSTTDGILMIDREDVIQVWNPMLEELTGLTAQQAEGRPLRTVMDAVSRGADGPLGSEPETVATWRGGRVMQERTANVFDEEGTEAGQVIVLRDVTRQREADALKSDFVARVSHELRTPLTPLIGFVELLRAHGDQFDPSIHATALDSMTRNARRLSTLVDELLLVVELDGGLQQRTAAVDLAPVVEAAIGRLRLDASGHVFDVAVPAGTFAAGDAERLTEVLAHLLDNAVRYSPAGARVEVTAAPEDDMIILRIRDRGPGIPPAAHELVFERFSRLENPLRMRTGGLGLGLFIARRLAASMGGTLRIGSSTPDGTTMEVRLPGVVSLDAPSGPGAEAPGGSQGDEAGDDHATAGRGQGTA